MIKKAIKITGGQYKFAKAINVAQSTVSKWNKGVPPNSKYIQSISDATKNEITVEELVKALDHRKQRR